MGSAVGFEQRQHRRVPLNIHLRYWTDASGLGPGSLVQSLNVSESGLAFRTPQPLEQGQALALAFSVPGSDGDLRVASRVVRCERSEADAGGWQARVQFLDQSRQVLLPIRRYVLQLSDPKLAASTGWGQAYFPGLPPMESEYRSLPAQLHQQWLKDGSFLPARQLGELSGFQDFIELALGSREPANFRLLGSRPLEEKGAVWLELLLPLGRLHLLAATLWCRPEAGKRAECGLQIQAYRKDEALRLDTVAA